MKRQSAEEYTKERIRDTEIPDVETTTEKIGRLIHEAWEIADENTIHFIAVTNGKAEFTGKKEELVTILIVAAAYVGVRTGVPAEKLEEVVTKLIRPAYEEVKNI